MTATLALIINVLLDLAMLGLLAFVSFPPGKLTAHRPGSSPAAVSPPLAEHAASERTRRHGERGPSRLHPALD